MLPGTFPIVAARSAPAALTYLDAAVETGSDRVFPGLNFGPESPDRYLCAAFGSTGTAISDATVTIGGVSATLIVVKTRVFGTSGFCGSGIWIAPVPTGVSGTVEINMVSGNPNVSVALYALTGLSNEGVASDTQTGEATALMTDPMTGTLAVPSGGVGIAAAFSTGNNAGDPSFVWTGLTAVNLNTRFGLSGAFDGTGAGNYTGVGGSVPITAEPQGSWTAATLVMASFV